MTTIAAYLSFDRLGASAVTLVSDSRVTWTDANRNIVERYNHSQKLFCLNKSATIFGYCGNSLFSLAAISQISAALDFSTEFIRSECMAEKARLVQEMLSSAAVDYPKDPEFDKTHLIQVSRIGKEFHVYEFSYNESKQSFEGRSVLLPSGAESEFIKAWGTGRASYKRIKDSMATLNNGKSARIFFRSLVLHLKHEIDSFSGGAPQMMVLRREKPPFPVGVYYWGSAYLLGLPYTAGQPLRKVEFRNEKYEFVDFNGTRRSHSQQHGYIDWRPDA